jgi:DNA polymerase-1
MVGNGLMRLGHIPKVTDTLVSARLAHPGERVSKGLGDCCSRYLGGHYSVWKASLERGFRAATKKTKAQMFKELGLSSPAYVAYSAFDVIMTARLAEIMPQAIDDRISASPMLAPADPSYLIEREQTINRMLLHRMSVGIEIDLDVVDEIKAEMWAVVKRADQELNRWGIDVELSRELIKRDALRVLDELGALGPRWPRVQSGAPSADKRYLERISHPIAGALKLRSQADRFASDYADKLVTLAGHDGRIHPQVGVLAAVSGRMSVNDPPLQQFPPSVRRMMRFDEPQTSLDWSSIEPVFIANAAGEAELVAEYELGRDLYLPVAEAAGVPRKVAKVVLLAQLYGQSVPSLAGALGRSEDDTQLIVTTVMSRMPKIKRVISRIKSACNVIGLVQTVSGRVLPIARDVRSAKGYMGYLGVNYYVQGSCYDLLAEALYEMHQRGLGDALGMAVHDELVVATEAATEIQSIMHTAPAALTELAGRVPLLRTGRVDMGHHWIEKG